MVNKYFIKKYNAYIDKKWHFDVTGPQTIHHTGAVYCLGIFQLVRFTWWRVP